MKKVIYIISFIGFFVFIIVYARQCREKDLAKNSRYTVGYATKKTWLNGYILQYEYSANGTIKKEGASLNINYDLYIGKRYFVKFTSDNSRILINMPVPDSVKEVPSKGWDIIEFKKLFGEEIPN